MHYGSCFAAREREAVIVCPSVDGGEIPGLQSCALIAPSALACPKLACPASGEMKRKKNMDILFSLYLLSLVSDE